METFGSCRLIINRNPTTIVGTFVTLEILIFFWWGDLSTLSLKWTPSTNANISSRYHVRFHLLKFSL